MFMAAIGKIYIRKGQQANAYCISARICIAVDHLSHASFKPLTGIKYTKRPITVTRSFVVITTWLSLLVMNLQAETSPLLRFGVVWFYGLDVRRTYFIVCHYQHGLFGLSPFSANRPLSVAQCHKRIQCGPVSFLVSGNVYKSGSFCFFDGCSTGN
jgi:hypothetical protein